MHLRNELRDNLVACFIEHVVHLLETVLAEVGVGHADMLPRMGEIHDEVYVVMAFPMFLCQCGDIVEVGLVHGQDEVKLLKICGLNLSRPVSGNVNTIFAGNADGARVGLFSGMPIPCTGRIHRPGKSFLSDFFL